VAHDTPLSQIRFLLFFSLKHSSSWSFFLPTKP
jgi:hypothetical protein